MLIKWIKTALRSVDEIADYIAKVNPTRAIHFVLELHDAVTKLRAHPGIDRAGRVPGTCELALHKNYIAIYRVHGEDIEILKLHHATEIDNQPGQPLKLSSELNQRPANSRT